MSVSELNSSGKVYKKFLTALPLRNRTRVGGVGGIFLFFISYSFVCLAIFQTK